MNSTELDSEDIMKTTKMKSNKEILNDTLTQKSGIYKIINKIDGKYYVGSTKDFDKRWRKKHRKQLRGNYHYNQKLQNAWNKYGENSFEFQILEEVVDVKELYPVEQRYLDIAKQEQDKCYNLKFVAEGVHDWSEETLLKMKRMRRSSEYRKKMSDAAKKRPKRYGCKCPETAKQMISEKAKRRLSIPENNPNFDCQIYRFVNVKSGDTFVGTRKDFRIQKNVTEHIERHIITEFKNSGKYVTSFSGWRLDTHQ